MRFGIYSRKTVDEVKNDALCDCGHRKDDHDEHDHEEMFANLIHANYIQQDAEFTGYEIEIGKTFNLGSGELTLSFGRDDVEAEFSDGHNVPRINPARNIYTISYIENDWVFKVSLKDVEKQDDVGEGETVTDSYQMLNTRLTKTYILHRTFINKTYETEAFIPLGLSLIHI